MNFLVNLIDYLISSKRTFIYSTYSLKEYYRIVSKLKSATIKYRVASNAHMSYHTGVTKNDYGSEYKFYVKKEDEHKALQAIHSK
ncbi:hypothetical protein SAMN05421743_103172 [Thalassobacillus cyri]|uniref:Uncharacterized protein n=1 Tax=Thalassobacillus cyri TaxID=571932 RepID=A0A1H3Z9T1_9BACI|nr:hypothetical protein [Thalassobacillus cyri]SEA20496.1 hypothetical protein SAMN05421743_103172 [Thalassobacillus cyri]